MASARSVQKFLAIATLVFVGEAIFSLPFHVTRFFRPTMLEVFKVNNLQLGAMFSGYGLVAMLAYFPGGTLADRYPARKLMAASALTTALGGLYMVTIPSITGMTLLYAYWGLTSILLFWAAMIRATREWGGTTDQGKAFGILDGGRGLLAAAFATVTVYFFGLFLPEDPTLATDAQRRESIQFVISAYTGLTAMAAVLVWFFIPEEAPSESDGTENRVNFSDIKEALKLPSVWLIALIVICAYCGYKALDNYSIFAVDAYGMNEVEGAKLSTWAAWIRPFAAIGIGLSADKISSSRASGICFAAMVISYLLFVVVDPVPSELTVLYFTIFLSAASIYGLRGVYFAIMEETHVPPKITGTAVGVISFVGYTPDIFIMPVAGWLIDRSPGATGHQHFFAVMLGLSLLGLAAVFALRRMNTVQAED